jgi:hypothetical protein
MPTLFCNLTEEQDLKPVIDRINSNSVDGSEQRFYKLILINGNHYRLTDSYFGNVSFENIYLGTDANFVKIKFISCNAFKGIAHRIRNFIVRSDYLKNDIELFGAITSMTNLETLGLESRFSILPRNAFKTPKSCYPLIDCVQRKLRSIRFRIGVNSSLIFLEEIESNVFYDLPNLQLINLHSQDIYYVYKNAFAFRDNSDKVLQIAFISGWNKNFKGEGFEIGAFENIKRPVILNFTDNHMMKHLDEAVFRPFLDADERNQILIDTPLVCDCKMYWLFKDRNKYQNRFIRFIYLDNAPKILFSYTLMCVARTKDFWSRTEDDFKACHQKL